MLLPPSPASINQGLTVGWFLFSSCSGFYIQQTRLHNSLLTGIDKSHVNKLQSILRVAARLVMRKGKFESISSDIRDKFHWLPIQQRIKFKIGVLVYRCLHGTAPPYLSEKLSAAADIADRRSLRSAAPRCSTFQNCQIRLPNVRCFGSHFLELVDEWTQKFQFNWTCF